MLKLMTADEYSRERDDLSLAIATAEQEVHSASFRERTGAGTPADTQAAKDHLLALRSSLEDHEAVWIGSQAEARRQIATDRRDAFAGLTAAIESDLAERRKHLQTVDTHISKAIAAALQYRESDEGIRRKIVAHAMANGSKIRPGDIVGYLTPGVEDLATRVMSARLGDARYQSIGLLRSADAFGGLGPLAREDALAETVRYVLDRVEPVDEAA